MARLILFNKPYGVICQFSPDGQHPTLKDYLPVPDVYPAGRLDTDSEGLLLLTDDGKLQQRISHPLFKLPKTYWAQVEGVPEEAALRALRQGVNLSDFTTLPADVAIIDAPPGLWPRNPPIRERRQIPTTWLALTIREGKNRQIRRMTAAVGHPTLRLIRAIIGPYQLGNLLPGQWEDVDPGPLLPAVVSSPSRAHRSPQRSNRVQSRRRKP